jgi:hypothetical protein
VASASSRAQTWLSPSVRQLTFFLCLGYSIVVGGNMLSADGDPSRHLVVGERMLATASIPHRDLFSHTMAGQPFVPYEWLAEVASAASFRVAGLAGPVLLHGAVFGLALVLLFQQVRDRGHSLAAALATVLGTLSVASIHWLARPHAFTMLGAAAFCALLDGWYAGRRRATSLWLLPAAMLLWVNLHGGFLIGLLLIAAYAVADGLRWSLGPAEVAGAARRRLGALALPAAATVGATLVNPAGAGLFGHVLGYFGKDLLVDNTLEYRSPDFHSFGPQLFLAMVALLLVGLIWSRRRPSLHEGLLLVGFVSIALYSVRNVPLFAIAAAPVLATLLAGLPDPRRARARLPGAVVALGRRLAGVNETAGALDARSRGHLWSMVVLTALSVLAALQVRAGGAPLGIRIDPTSQPVAAVRYLEAHPPQGNVFNQMSWGGYLLLEQWPRQRVFIDGQTDFYGEALTREYLDVALLAAGWEAVLDRHDVAWVLFPTDSALVRRLAVTPGWGTAFRDDQATVLVRRRE